MATSTSSPLSNVTGRVLIIGAGPFGLISLRNLTERGSFQDVVLYERRSDIGGVW